MEELSRFLLFVLVLLFVEFLLFSLIDIASYHQKKITDGQLYLLLKEVCMYGDNF